MGNPTASGWSATIFNADSSRRNPSLHSGPTCNDENDCNDEQKFENFGICGFRKSEAGDNNQIRTISTTRLIPMLGTSFQLVDLVFGLCSAVPRPWAFCSRHAFHFFRFFALFSAVGPPTQSDSFESFGKWNSGNNQRPGFPTAFPNAAHNACKVPKIAILSVGVVSDPSLGAVSDPYNGSERFDAHGRAQMDPKL